MILHNSSGAWRRLILVVVLGGLMLASCSQDEADALPEGCDGVTWGSGIEAVQRGNDYIAQIQGDMPDSCSTVCGHEQSVRGDVINIDLFSSMPEDMVCSQMLTPFRTEVLLDTEDLDPGEYTVNLNETHATTTFVLE